MFGNVIALEGLHVIREIEELEYDARMLQAGALHRSSPTYVPTHTVAPARITP